MSIERLRALEKKWRTAGDAETKRADGDGLSDGEQGWHHGRGEQYDNCADDLATLIAELGQEVGAVDPVAWLEAEPGTKLEELHNPDWPVGFARSTIMHMAMRKPIKRQPDNVLFPLFTSPAHTSEAMDAARLDWLDGFTADSGYRIEELFGSAGSKRYVTIYTRDGDTLAESENLREAIDAAMRQEGGNG